MNDRDMLQIQKCVDGELTESAQQQLLAQLDATDDGWKTLALAYVEDQTWRSVITADCERFSAPASEADPITRPPLEAAQLPQTRGRSARLTQLTWIAIALVGGILVGDVWQARHGQPTASGPATLTKSSKSQPSSNAAGNPVGNSNAYMVDLPTRDGRSVTLPAYPAGPLLQDPGPGLQLPPTANRQLKRLGFQSNAERGWVVFDLEDGQQLLMPLERLQISPGGQ